MSGLATPNQVEIRAIANHPRLDAFLAAQMPELSRSRLQELIRQGYVLLNGQPAKPRDAVRVGDAATVQVPEAVPDRALPEPIPLAVIFEDEHLIVIDKAPGMVVHPGPGNPTQTLVNALLHHCHGQLSGIGGVERPGIVHRLDKDTSGCMVAAKTDRAHQHLAAQFARRHGMEKLYLAVTVGVPQPLEDTIFTHIGRHPVHRQKMAVITPPAGKAALTDYRVVGTTNSSFPTTALVCCHLHTGRTHQIRVHLHYRGTPILGDPIYGRPCPGLAPGRLMLHSWKLSFAHPATDQQLFFTAPIPAAFQPWLPSAPGWA